MNTITSSGRTMTHVPARRKNGFGYRIGRALLALLTLIVGLATVGASYQAIATLRDRRAYPPPGQIVDVGGYKLHIHCIGAGSPTVILLDGLPSMSIGWTYVQPAVAQTTRVCAYDRAGGGWSDPGPAPHDSLHIADELHTLLVNADVPGPYVLVGHSFGGLYARMYADRYPHDWWAWCSWMRPIPTCGHASRRNLWARWSPADHSDSSIPPRIGSASCVRSAQVATPPRIARCRPDNVPKIEPSTCRASIGMPSKQKCSRRDGMLRCGTRGNWGRSR
jgi:alpha/beta hydrolase fold